MMNKLMIAVAVLVFASANNLQAADPWKEQPIARAFTRSIDTTIAEYEWWAAEWKREKRSPTQLDTTINLMAETTFIAIKLALDEHPNPQLLERCLLFLGTTVPPEFEYLWQQTMLEMADVDHAISRKVNETLKAKNLPTLEDRVKSGK